VRIEKTLRLLCVAPVDDVLVLRRLLRDSTYHVHAATTSSAALRALSDGPWHAVLVDDDVKLLEEVERRSPDALRILMAKSERRAMLSSGAQTGRYVLVLRPYFATRVREILGEHERRAHQPDRAEQHALDVAARPAVAVARPAGARSAAKVEATVAAGERTMDGDTKPYVVVSGAPVGRRRVLITMSELAEAKSGHSSGHGQRVSHMAIVLGRATGMQTDDLESLGEAALLHDVGELAIRSSILVQKRRLTPHELRELRCHVEAGEAILRRCGLARPALAAVRSHHERWDGRGYPDGLSRASIPLPARVLAVVDAWDALATARPWRPRLQVAEAERTLSLLGGSQLDPQLVDLFLSRRVHQSIDWSDPPRAEELLL
jgi:HD-GYP domain-containing protein (c-di-GMP phosphodiesterase class II)